MRSGLRTVKAIEGMTRLDGSPFEVRVGVNTGEALVRLDVTPGSGEGFLTGDAVNVAARLQAAAPPGGVAVGAATHDLTARTIDYEALAPVAAKGKSEPVQAWLALAPVSRMGVGVSDASLAPFVGRDVELTYLRALFDKAAAASPQFALIVGEPGIGKSRLVHELFTYVDSRSEMTTWRQGRCLPYGDGGAFGALSEIVKGHAGILDSDGDKVRRRKLDVALPETQDRVWMLERLGALAGVSAPEASLEENFAAWSRFLTDLAAVRPLAVVIEDLHRAGDPLLTFVERLVRGGTPGAFLLVLTARPELFDRRPAFLSPEGEGGAEAGPPVLRLDLGRLSDEEVRRIALAAAGESATDEIADYVTRAAAGNPLYAEESARLLAVGEPVSSLPGSVTAVYAARLDALQAWQKDVLADASVAGGVFWDGMLAATGDLRLDEVDEALRVLKDAHLVRPAAESTLIGEREFEFVHTFAREVAYRQLPRRACARRHAAVARWLEEKAAGQPGVLVDELAHHYSTACQLARAAGDTDLTKTLVAPALSSLRAAGIQAMALDASLAERRYSAALELASHDDSLWPVLAAEWGKSLFLSGRSDEARRAMEDGIGELKGRGHLRAAAVWSGELAGLLFNRDDPAWRDAADESVRLVEDDEPSEEQARVLAGLAYQYMTMDHDLAAAKKVLDRHAEVARALGISEQEYEGLLAGFAWRSGRRNGLERMRRLETMRPDNDGGIELCNATLAFDGPAAAVSFAEEHIAFFERTGNVFSAWTFRGMRAEYLLWAGDWETASAAASETASRLEVMGFDADLGHLQACRLLLTVWTGTSAEKAELVADVASRGKRSCIADNVYSSSVALAAVERAGGQPERAQARITAAAAVVGRLNPEYVLPMFPEAVRIALELGERDAAGTIARTLSPVLPLAEHAAVAAAALRAEAKGKHEAAMVGFAASSSRWHDFGVPYEEAQALLGLGRCLAALGRALEAARTLEQARVIFERLGAKPALEETEEWLAKAL